MNTHTHIHVNIEAYSETAYMNKKQAGKKRGCRNECTGSLEIEFIRHKFSNNFAYYIQGGKNSITKKLAGNWNLLVKTGK